MPKTAIFERNYLFQTIVVGIHLSKFKRGRIDFRRATNRSWVYCPCLLEFQNIEPITERLPSAFEDASGILKDENKRTEWMKHIHSSNNHKIYKMTIYMTNDIRWNVFLQRNIGNKQESRVLQEIVTANVLELAKNKVSSNVVERCFEVTTVGPDAGRLVTLTIACSLYCIYW